MAIYLQRNFRVALACLGLSQLACTGQVLREDESSSTGVDGQPAFPGGSASSGTNGSASVAPGEGASASLLPAWAGSVGSWCGPEADATFWLVASPTPSACQAAAQEIHPASSSGEPAEGLSLQLDTVALATLPARFASAGRYCAAGAALCTEVQVALDVSSYTPGSGLSGTWAFTLPDGTERRGTLQAGWCNWDEVLPAHPEAERLARDLRIQEVSVYQGVKVPIVREMQAVAQRNADLVQQREALVRIFVAPDASFQPREITARITLQNEGEPERRFEETMLVSATSREEDGMSTFNIELPKDAFRENTQYSVELREVSRCTALSGVPSGARFPEVGVAPVAARLTGPVKVMVVPVRYDADGSGRLPDTSPAQLEQMKRRLYSMYPTSEVVLDVRDAVGTNYTDLGDMLDQMRELRDADAPPSDLSYYGMVMQADDFREYCKGSCTTGIAGFGTQNGTASAGMGIGFPDSAANTFVHELGHIYRRPHSPCGGATGTDESYPYPEANLGSWGYDLQTHELFDPSDHVDFMSYCSPDWISDYNYQLILERIVVVNQAASLRRISTGPPRAYRTLRVAPNGGTRWGLDLHPRGEPPGDPISVEVLDQQGAVLTRTTAYEQQVGDGERAVFVPAAEPGWFAVRAPGVAPAEYGLPSATRPFQR